MKSRIRNRLSNLAETAFLNFALTFAKALLVLLLTSWAMISIVHKKDEGIKPKAEFMITVTWDTGDYDVDTWVQSPDSEYPMYYRRKEVGLINLDRDDTGSAGDTIVVNNIAIQSENNQEQTSVRGIVPGDYVLNVHMYRWSDNSVEKIANDNGRTADNTRNIRQTDGQLQETKAGTILPIPVKGKIEIVKLNPNVKLVYEAEFELTMYKQEIHICRFTVTDKGEAINVTDQLPVSLVSREQTGGFVKPKGAP